MLQRQIFQRVLILFLAELGAMSCFQAQPYEKVVCMSSCIGYSTEVDTWQVYERFLTKIVVRGMFFAGRSFCSNCTVYGIIEAYEVCVQRHYQAPHHLQDQA